jgi:hypothetical protein
MTQVPYRSICQRQQSPSCVRLRGVEKFDATNDANTASKYFLFSFVAGEEQLVGAAFEGIFTLKRNEIEQSSWRS